MWDKLLGFYGDALLRKFDAEPPAEWVEAMGLLTDAQITRGVRRIMFGAGAKGVPSLPEFVRFCRTIGDEAPDEGPRQLIALPAADDGKFDGWAITSNNRFLKYVIIRLTADPSAWGARGSMQQAEATRVAVAYKNAWAQDMREGDSVDTESGEIIRLPRDVQDRAWIDAMGRAEADIMLLMRGKAA